MPVANGRIGMTICPGKHSATSLSGHGWARDLPTDLQAIKGWGGNVLVATLMETWELKQYQVPQLGQEVEAAGMRWFHLPIVDGRAPDIAWDLAWETHGKSIRTALHEGQSVLIHCLGGRGRTGTLAARLLMEFGDSANTAISKVRAARDGMIETADQEQYLYQLDKQLNIS